MRQLGENPEDPPVAVRDLRKLYGDVDRRGRRRASTSRPGSITALLGGNGAGKTTTIAMLMGWSCPRRAKPVSSVLTCPSNRHKRPPPDEFREPLRRCPPCALTVRQNLEIFARLYGVVGFARRIEELSDELKLGEFLDRPYGKLSAGQKTRVSIAKALPQRSRASPSRRADRLPRSRHRRLGAHPPRGLPRPRPRRHRPARHRTTWPRSSALRTASSCSRRGASSPTRHPEQLDPPLWPQYARGGLPRHSPKHAPRRPSGASRRQCQLIIRKGPLRLQP